MFKNVFEWGGQVPVKGLHRTQLFVLGAVLIVNWCCSTNGIITNYSVWASKPFCGRHDL